MKKARTTILLQSQIETAMKMTRSNAAAAEYLRVGYNLYKKFAKLYKNEHGESLFSAHLNQSGRGLSKTHVSKKRIQLDEVLIGRHSNYPREKLLRRMIISGYIEEKCNHCGYCQKRPSDLKTPLILHTINGNKTDFKLENLEVLCFNCYFVIVGNISRRDIKHNRYDVPEQHNPAKVDLIDDEKSLQALSTMDLLTDEEKMELISKLNDI
jgi:hypothetical protein